METDEAMRRIGSFLRFFKDIYTLDFAPATGLVNTGFCGRFGQNYALFLASGGSVTLNLAAEPGTNTFDVIQIDAAVGTVTTNGLVTGGGVRVLNTGSDGATALLLKRQVRPRIDIKRQGQGALLHWPAEPCGYQLWYATKLYTDFQRASVAPTQSLSWVAAPVDLTAPACGYRLQR